jgi:hypothetical protein
MKRRIRLSENDLHRIIKETVRQIVNEYDKSGDYMTFGDTTMSSLDSILNSTPSQLSDAELEQAVNYLQAYGYKLSPSDKQIAQDFYDELDYSGL